MLIFSLTRLVSIQVLVNNNTASASEIVSSLVYKEYEIAFVSVYVMLHSDLILLAGCFCLA